MDFHDYGVPSTNHFRLRTSNLCNYSMLLLGAKWARTTHNIKWHEHSVSQSVPCILSIMNITKIYMSKPFCLLPQQQDHACVTMSGTLDLTFFKQLTWIRITRKQFTSCLCERGWENNLDLVRPWVSFTRFGTSFRGLGIKGRIPAFPLTSSSIY